MFRWLKKNRLRNRWLLPCKVGLDTHSAAVTALNECRRRGKFRDLVRSAIPILRSTTALCRIACSDRDPLGRADDHKVPTPRLRMRFPASSREVASNPALGVGYPTPLLGCFPQRSQF